MQDKRKRRRTLTTAYADGRGIPGSGVFEVHDRAGSRLFGYLLDITIEGFRVIGNEEMPKNVVYEQIIELPEPIDGNTFLVVDARSVWCRRDGKTGMYHTGYQILNAPVLTIEVIEKLIEQLEGYRQAEDEPSESTQS